MLDIPDLLYSADLIRVLSRLQLPGISRLRISHTGLVIIYELSFPLASIPLHSVPRSNELTCVPFGSGKLYSVCLTTEKDR